MLATIQRNLESLRENQDGATAIEYALLASFVAMAIIVTVTVLGIALEGLFSDVLGIFAGPV